MAVPKRLRYEILRRDSYTCRYCGATAPSVPLRIDHVVPIALGGTDTPDNLVTACEPCNSGKTSTSPDAPLVNNVAQDALRWSQAMQAAAAQLADQDKEKDAYRAAFRKEWKRWKIGPSGKALPLPPEWRATVERFRVAGLPASAWPDTVDAAMSRDKVDDKLRYICGVAWNKITELQTIARQHLTPTQAPTESLDDHDSYACLVEYLADEWFDAWTRSAGRNPTRSEYTAFTKSVFQLDGDLVLRKDYMFAAAVLAGRAESTNIADYLDDRVTADDEAVELNAAAEWYRHWISRDADAPPPSDDDQAVIREQVKAAVLSAYKSEAIISAASQAGFFRDVRLSPYLLTVPQVIELGVDTP